MSDVEPQVPNPNPSGTEVPPEYSVPIDAASLASHYERDDVNVRAILWFAGGLLVVLIIVQVLLFWMVRSWSGRPLSIEPQLAPSNATPVPVQGPGLDANPEAELDTLLGGEAERLNGYGWIDREGGVVRIPIERAMSLLVEQGLPASEGEPPNFELAPAFRLDSSGGTGGSRENAGGDTGDKGASDDEAGDKGAADE
ncbi:MAG: hypothetical protein IT328_18570 [Caldilineaceae bacterium]|nr:hypothetical protein [Caldilineaceae bacterium]